MKKNDITCEVIQDLLLLYEDNCCSAQTRNIVEEHLKECENCRENKQQFQEILPKIDEEEEVEIKGIKQGIRKINRWKNRGIVLLCLIIVLIFVVFPTWNHIQGSGLSYTNLKETYIAYAFERALVAGDYEKAYSYLNMEYCYNALLATDTDSMMRIEGNEKSAKAIAEGIQEIEEKGFDWYNKVCKEKFMKSMESLEEMDEMLCSYSDFDIQGRWWSQDEKSQGWTIVYHDIQTKSGQKLRMQLNIFSEGITNFHVSVDNPTGEILDNDELGQKALMFDRLYRTPSVNETVMEIMYNGTDYDWTKLFVY